MEQLVALRKRAHAQNWASFFLFASMCDGLSCFYCIHSQRKLRSFERKQDSMQRSMDEALGEGDASLSFDAHLTKTKSICSDDESLKTMTMLSTESNTETKTTPQATPEASTNEPKIRDDEDRIYTNSLV